VNLWTARRLNLVVALAGALVLDTTSASAADPLPPGTTARPSSPFSFSEMDFLPTFAAILGAKLPTDRPIDGVDQTAVLLGKSEAGAREAMLTFMGPDLVAAARSRTTRRSTTSRWIRTKT
jgi:hypothetical protein